MITSVGILGGGKLGLVLARLSLQAGLSVNIAGSGDPAEIALSMKVLAPGARTMTQTDVIKYSDVIILALPLGKYKTIATKGLKDKLVIDAMNYWWEVDGIRPELDNAHKSTSEIVRDFLPTNRVVKAFSHMGYHDLLDYAAQDGNSERKAIAIAGDDTKDIKQVSQLIEKIGYEPLHIGDLPKGIMLQPGSNLFGANGTKQELLDLIEHFPKSDLGKRLSGR